MEIHKIELVGCGALAEQIYAPALRRLERAGRVNLIGLVDTDAKRLDMFGRAFPSANKAQRVEDLPAADGALAIIASPPFIHAAQTRTLLAGGRHVLCEKPLATSVAEARAMVAAAKSARRLLAAGMIRRFYPSAQALREGLAAGILGEVKMVSVIEGGKFGWGAASPKFFEKSNGGVLYDLGSHVLDLLCHWFGAPNETASWNDAMGGANTNCVLEATWETGISARVRLSWDTAQLRPGIKITGTRAECRWDGSPDGTLNIKATSGAWQLHGAAQREGDVYATGWAAAFARQLDNVLGAIEGKNTLLAPAEDVLPSLRWLEAARNQARPMPQPWLSLEEQKRAKELAQT